MEIGKILRKARLDSGYTMKTVEAATGVIASRQSKIELGETLSPDFMAVARLVEFYGLSLEGVYEAAKTGSDAPAVAAKALKCQHIPIISWVQAGSWSESVLDGCDFDVIPSPFKCTNDAYALKVRGDSMTSAPGSQYDFPHDSLIIVEPNAEARHRSFVVARIEGTDEVTFKRLNIEDGKFLQPLNPQYPVLPIDKPISICGVVIGVIQKIKW